MSHADSAQSTIERDARIAALEAELASSQERIAALEKERDSLRAAYERLKIDLDLMRRRLFVAKAERVDTTQLQLEFALKLRELDALANTLGMAKDETAEGGAGDDGEQPKRKKKGKTTGRRDLGALPIDDDRIEITDPHLEQLVAEGKIARHGFEETFKLARKRGGMYRVVIARAKYRTVDAAGNADVITAPMHPEMLPRSIATPSLVAHAATEKVCKGLPFFRVEDSFAREGVPVDRATMSRWMKLVGTALGETVVPAMRADAMATAFCIATDATGIAVQPARTQEKQARQACKKGHFLVQIADRDHVFFEYLERETSANISACFRGFSGYVQADAKAVFDVLYRAPDDPRSKNIEHDGGVRSEVGCWSHCRRRFWEAAMAKSVVGREAVMRIARIFELDASWRKKPPSEIKALRDKHLRPHLEEFFRWVDEQFPLVREQRGLLNSAFGYAHRHRAALMRVLEDGRLILENNRSERELRAVAVGRKAWLFVGSDDHAKSTAHLFSMVASARLHGLDPEQYLRDMIRLVPFWPKDRFLELAPKYWAATRARLDVAALEREAGVIVVPDPVVPVTTPEEQSTPG